MKRAAFIRMLVAAPLAGWPPLFAGGEQVSPRKRAILWLISRQSEDGAWRSDTYGAFRDGLALTPLVLRALVGEPQAADACRKAAAWLTDRGAAVFGEYPVHHASAILEAAPECPGLAGLSLLARRKLLELQCPRSGGWSYATTAPPATGNLAPMQQANLAATAMAIDGLKAAKLDDTTLLSRVLSFVKVCQNFGADEPGFDDGGFFQLPDDPARNKAGQAGKDSRGVVRYFSYASATADGLRAMLHLGEPADSPRVKAAGKWLESFRWNVAGSKKSPADLCYYTARSLKKTGGLCSAVKPVDEGILASAQDTDGSWKNRAGEMREDCPIVATALAVEVLGS